MFILMAILFLGVQLQFVSLFRGRKFGREELLGESVMIVEIDECKLGKLNLA